MRKTNDYHFVRVDVNPLLVLTLWSAFKTRFRADFFNAVWWTKFWHSLVTGTSVTAPWQMCLWRDYSFGAQSRYRHSYLMHQRCAYKDYLLYREESKLHERKERTAFPNTHLYHSWLQTVDRCNGESLHARRILFDIAREDHGNESGFGASTFASEHESPSCEVELSLLPRDATMGIWFSRRWSIGWSSFWLIKFTLFWINRCTLRWNLI